MEKRKSFENAKGAKKNKRGIDKNKSGRAIQVCFSERGKITGSWMDIVIMFLIFFSFVVHIIL